MQGGIHPDLPGTAYFDIARAVKERVPGMHVHAFSPMEVVNGAARTGHVGARLADRGQGGGPRLGPRHRGRDPRRRRALAADQGQAARLGVDRRHHHRARGRPAVELDDDVRPRRQPVALAGPLPHPGRASRTAPAGSPSSSALPFIHTNAPIYLAGVARPGPDGAREPGRARDGAHPAARTHRQHPVLVGEARRRRLPAGAHRRRQRPRRDADGGDDQPDGRQPARVGQDRRAAATRSSTACPGGAPASA